MKKTPGSEDYKPRVSEQCDAGGLGSIAPGALISTGQSKTF